jgi:hypothetical protein
MSFPDLENVPWKLLPTGFFYSITFVKVQDAISPSKIDKNYQA